MILLLKDWSKLLTREEGIHRFLKFSRLYLCMAPHVNGLHHRFLFYMYNVHDLQVPCGVPPVAPRARNPRHVPRRARQLHAVVHPVGHHQRHLRELAADPEVVMTHTRVVNRLHYEDLSP